MADFPATPANRISEKLSFSKIFEFLALSFQFLLEFSLSFREKWLSFHTIVEFSCLYFNVVLFIICIIILATLAEELCSVLFKK